MLVRNAYFDVTFTVPTVVRADEEFSVFATVTNVGQGAGNDVKMTLDPARLSGARLLSTGDPDDRDTRRRGDAATLEYRFRSEVTGEVVASYLRFDTSGGVDVTGRLNFMLGVGERRVALSPDTLVLPARGARAAVRRGARRDARARPGLERRDAPTTLPPGVERPSTEAVFRKGLAVAEAGLRVELGQPLADALRDLLFDLHGRRLDPGFDQVLRETTAGRDLDRALGATLAQPRRRATRSATRRRRADRGLRARPSCSRRSRTRAAGRSRPSSCCATAPDARPATRPAAFPRR